MWMMTKYGFFSATSARQEGNRKGAPIDPANIQVRVRTVTHLENLQGRFASLRKFKIIVSRDTDYIARIIVPRDVWAWVVKELAEETMYDNFKGECHHTGMGGRAYEDALHRVWSNMYTVQEKCHGRGIYSRPEPVTHGSAWDNAIPASEPPKKKASKKAGSKRGKNRGAKRSADSTSWLDRQAVDATSFDGEPALVVSDQDTGTVVGCIWQPEQHESSEAAYAMCVNDKTLELTPHPEFVHVPRTDEVRAKLEQDGVPVI
jgi:hypothetical protein